MKEERAVRIWTILCISGVLLVFAGLSVWANSDLRSGFALFMDEQLSFATLFMVMDISLAIGSNSGINEPKVSLSKVDIGILKRAPMVAQGFDLSTQ